MTRDTPPLRIPFYPCLFPFLPLLSSSSLPPSSIFAVDSSVWSGVCTRGRVEVEEVKKSCTGTRPRNWKESES